MDDALPVRLDEGGGHLRDEVERVAELQTMLFQVRAQRRAVHELRGEEAAAVHRLPDVVDRDDVRMIQSRGRERLTPKALQAPRVGGDLGREELQGDGAAQLR